jgi:PAS domain S-box-containing protein
MGIKDPLQRISQLRRQLEDLKAQSPGVIGLTSEVFSDALSELQAIEELLGEEKGAKKSNLPEEGISKEHLRHGANEQHIFNNSGKCIREVVCVTDFTECRRMEEALRKIDEVHKLLFENAIDGIALHTLTAEGLPDKFTHVNGVICRMLGYSKEELCQLGPMDIQQDDGPNVILEERRMMLSEKHNLFQKLLVTKDGKVVPVEIHATLFDLHEKPIVLAIIRDITKRKKMEEALWESKDYLNKIINSIGDPIFVKDRQHRYVLVNDAHCNIAGLEREKIIGSTSHDLFPKDQADVFWEKDEEVFETGRENVNEERVTDAQGNVRTVVTRKTLHMDKTENKFLVGIARDITDRKRIEDELRLAQGDLEKRVQERTAELEKANIALRNAKEYLDKIINSIGDPIFVKDRQHRVILVNDAACKLFCRSREDIEGKTAYELFPNKEMADISSEKDEEVFITGVENVNEETNTYAPGDTRTVLVKKTLYTDNAGNKYLVGVTRDITDRKRAENELKEAKEAAEAAVRSKSEFLANMSHEIRTPLNAVVGLTGLLLSADLTPEQRDYVETVRSSGNSLLSVINDILDFSKIEGGKMELENQSFDLRGCIEVALDLVEANAVEKGLTLCYFLEDRVPTTIMGDVTRLRQVLANLLSNAVKFTGSGTVEISVTGQPVADDQFEIHFAIKDTGIGIPEDKLGRLFQSFSQIDSSTTRKYGGTGLGLAISKRLVEMMNGRIWVESCPGKGSTFHFTIMTEAATSKPIHPAAGSKEQRICSKLDRSRPLRILLAEDNAVNQKVALQMLKRLGYNADVAANGLEVLQALERQQYDVVLMDIQMPEMDGIDAAQKIRERWPNGPKIIAITAYALEGDRERCIKAGMDNYIAKPIQIEELRSVLDVCA